MNRGEKRDGAEARRREVPESEIAASDLDGIERSLHDGGIAVTAATCKALPASATEASWLPTARVAGSRRSGTAYGRKPSRPASATSRASVATDTARAAVMAPSRWT